MKILNFGSCNIDYVYSLDHIVAEGETETTHDFEVFPGGKGLNQSIAAARAGADVYHAGFVGEDGAFLRAVLEDSGVNVSYMNNIESKNGHAIIQVGASGENSIFLYPGSNEMLTQEYIDRVLEHFGSDDLVLLQNEINLVDYIVDEAFKKGMTIVLNPSPFNKKIANISFEKLSYLILNEVEAKAVSGYSEPEKVIEFFRINYPRLKIVLTLGVNGSIYMEDEHQIDQTAYEVEAVDTTAAGDTFTGYFVAGLAKRRGIAQILKTSSAASALSVSRKGAAPSIPRYEEVAEALIKLKSNRNKNKADILLRKIDTYIGENLKTANLNELAKLLGYSVVYTGSLVKKLTGESFRNCVYKKRCEVAAYKLRHTDFSVEEIISSIGYENKNFFRKLFKQQYGENPLEYRKKNMNNCGNK